MQSVTTIPNVTIIDNMYINKQKFYSALVNYIKNNDES